MVLFYPFYNNVYYDYNVNKSGCGAFGPGINLARIIGLSGDNVSFSRCSFEANGYTGTVKCSEGIWPKTKIVIWGSDKYEDVAVMELIVPAEEFLADNWTGYECTGEIDETGCTKFYHRFTVKREAIKGVIIKKLWHDDEFEEWQKGIVY